MKKFWNVILVWFLIQVLILSAASNTNALRTKDMSLRQEIADCYEDTSFALGFVGGLLFPITIFEFVGVDYCWNNIKR